MIIVKIALRNILRKPRQTILLGSLILIGMTLVFLSNTIFEGTKQGLKRSYAGSLTSDIIITEKNTFTTSIFGNDMPLIGEYQTTPALSFFPQIEAYLHDNQHVENWTPVISTFARLEYGNQRENTHIFGIDSNSYFQICNEIDISNIQLDLLQAGKKGVAINKNLLEALEQNSDKKLEIGDALQLTFATANSFNIEKAVFAGSYSYVSDFDPFNRIILSDPNLLRELIDYANIETVSIDNLHTIDDLGDLESLFFTEEEDFEATKKSDSFLTIIEDTLTDISSKEENTDFSNGLWNFILVNTAKGKAALVEKDLRAQGHENDWGIKVLNWRLGSGLNSQAAFALQITFNAGLIFIIIAAVLVLMNGLMISVLERMSEIGTMRAIGSNKAFIAKLFFTESAIMVCFFSFFGIIIGILFSFFVLSKNIALDNEILMSLFGGKTLHPVVTLPLISYHILGAVTISILSWIYPMFIALRVAPAQVMGKNV
ncbi:MAG: ABC transporter permease [Treponemataceae bacterium]